jgi:soluble lytic murein transglycosylase-like protein
VKLLHKFGIATALLALACVAGSCAEIAVLRNGFAIRHEHREGRGAQTRLYLDKTQDNYVEVPTTDIAGFENDDPSSPQAIAFRPRRNLDQVVREAGDQNNIDPDLINSVIRAESGFNPNAVSPKGAQGLMQLMPQTAVQLGVLNAMDPAANVEGGTRYLRELLARYHNDLAKALAAYNAGPERVEQYRGMPPYPETLAFVARIIVDFNRKKFAQQRSLPDPTRNVRVGRNSNANPVDVLPRSDVGRTPK